jgi:AAA+ superfamily predicted ATPase
MTAEGLAQKTNRRLIRIDATDFHYSDPSQVSQAFQKYFHCAHKWGTLLLLDEADVFLQSRKARDLAQNALVSVLLRELEYFKGVLIMTTNRVLTIDTAMESRIHYTVKFRDLNQTSLVQIFETFARQLNKENCRDEDKREILAWVKAEASDLVQKSLTGRDIRNILTTAQLLDWPFITHDNFRAILRNTGNFRQDMAARANAEHEANAAPRQRQTY